MSKRRTLLDIWRLDDGSRAASEPAPRRPSGPPQKSEPWRLRLNFDVGANVSTLVAFVLFVSGMMAIHGPPCGCENRVLANEVAAIGSLKQLREAQRRFRESDPSGRYAESLAELSAEGTDLIGDILGSGGKQGFGFEVKVDAANDTWCAEAHAASEHSGRRRFYLDPYGGIFESDKDPTAPVPLEGHVGPPPGFRELGK